MEYFLNYVYIKFVCLIRLFPAKYNCFCLIIIQLDIPYNKSVHSDTKNDRVKSNTPIIFFRVRSPVVFFQRVCDHVTHLSLYYFLLVDCCILPNTIQIRPVDTIINN